MAKILQKGFSFDDVLIIPKYNPIQSRRDVEFKTRVTRNFSLEIPLIASNMDTVCEDKMAIAIGKLGGLGILHRFCTINEQTKWVKNVKKKNLICAAAIGVKDYHERLEALSNAGVDIVDLDVAHAHSKITASALTFIKKKYPKIDVMVGNIATKEAADFFIRKGADALKVGIGPGSMCTTRIMTGAGVPQITAIMDVFHASQGTIPVCADGGIKFPGDIVKAIGAGADTVMLGSVLSGTSETPGKIIIKNSKKFKQYRGMASYEATVKKLKIDGKSKKEVISVEGEGTLVELKGPVENIIKKKLGGLASGMTYVGAKTIAEIKGKVDFIEISNAGMKESVAHGVKTVQ